MKLVYLLHFILTIYLLKSYLIIFIVITISLRLFYCYTSSDVSSRAKLRCEIYLVFCSSCHLVLLLQFYASSELVVRLQWATVRVFVVVFLYLHCAHCHFEGLFFNCFELFLGMFVLFAHTLYWIYSLWTFLLNAFYTSYSFSMLYIDDF